MTELALQEKMVTHGKIEELPRVYTHKCFSCEQLFNDIEPPEFRPFSEHTWYSVRVFDKDCAFAALCRRCIIPELEFYNRKLKTCSNPFQDDKLGISGEVMKKPEENK